MEEGVRWEGGRLRKRNHTSGRPEKERERKEIKKRTTAKEEEAARERSRERRGAGENIISDVSGGSHLVKFSHHLESSSCPLNSPDQQASAGAKCLLKSEL